VRKTGKIFEKHRTAIHGMVHCSGGGQTKVMHFVENLHVIKDNLFTTPQLFKIIQQAAGTHWKEMYNVFNMGHRMEIYCDKSEAENLIAVANSFDVEAKIVGYVENSDKKKLTLKTENGTIEY